MELDTNQFPPLPQDGLGQFYKIAYHQPAGETIYCTCWGNSEEEALQVFRDTHDQEQKVLSITLDIN